MRSSKIAVSFLTFALAGLVADSALAKEADREAVATMTVSKVVDPSAVASPSITEALATRYSCQHWDGARWSESCYMYSYQCSIDWLADQTRAGKKARVVASN